MGMAASQARFLSLTARKSNTEYQGQQINQERTALANESSNIFAQLSKMEVPTPPNTADFYKTVYSFTATELSEKGTKETYKLDEIVSTPDGDKAYVTYKQPYYSVANSNAASYGVTVSAAGALSNEEKTKLGDLANSYANLAVTLPNGTKYNVFKETAKSVESTAKLLGDTENGGNADFASYYLNADGSANDNFLYYYMDGNQKCYLDYNSANLAYNDTSKFGKTLTDENNTPVRGILPNSNTYIESYDSVMYNAPTRILTFDSEEDFLNYVPPLESDTQITARIPNASGVFSSALFTYDSDGKLSSASYTDYGASHGTPNMSNNVKEYLNQLTYKKAEAKLEDARNNSSKTTNTALYVGTNYTTQKAELDVIAYEENDLGRLTSITIKIGENDDGTPITKKYELDCTKEEDEAAYKQAMLDYEYEYAKYQKAVSDLNNKTEEIQQKDKTLELELKQLDTEQNAIKTEMDAVQKVIEDNTESTFKTFG